ERQDAPYSRRLLCLVAERTAIRARVQRLAAVPAEARCRYFAGAEARLNLRDLLVACRHRAPRHRCASGASGRWLPRGRDVGEEIRGALVALRQIGCERAHDDV